MASEDEAKLQLTRPRSTTGTRYLFQFLNDQRRGVFAIAKISHSGVIELQGTGFFLSPDGVFATARHVFEIDVDPGDQFELWLECDDGAVHRVPIDSSQIEKHDLVDVAAGRLESEVLRTLPCHMPWVDVMRLDPEPKEPLGTFVFAQTVVYDPETEEGADDSEFVQRVKHRCHWEVGHAITTHNDGHRLVKGRCHETSVFIEGRGSGGPMFNANGFVVGVNSTGMAEDDAAPNSLATSICHVDELELHGTPVVELRTRHGRRSPNVSVTNLSPP